MGRKRNNGLSEEKRNIIGQLIEMYDIKTAADIQEALKDLLGGTIQSMLEAEMDEQVSEREAADSEYHDSRKSCRIQAGPCQPGAGRGRARSDLRGCVACNTPSGSECDPYRRNP